VTRHAAQVWNPSNCEIWVLEKLPAGEYELSGRWRASPYGGDFVDIRFGRNKNQPLFEHMKTKTDVVSAPPSPPRKTPPRKGSARAGTRPGGPAASAILRGDALKLRAACAARRGKSRWALPIL
jgi:hypothetical protein